jgi:hypothetical protein
MGKMRNLYCGLLFIVLCACGLTGCQKDDNEITKIVVASSKMVIGIGKTSVIYASPFPDRADKGALHWSSDDASIATVDQSGNVTGVSTGSTYVNAEYKGITESVLIEVYEPLTDLNLTPSSLTVNLEILFGAAGSFKYEVAPVPSTSNEVIAWKSADPAIATVSQAGLITATNAGTTTISVEGSGGVVKKSITVTVTKIGEDPVRFDSKLFIHKLLPGDNHVNRSAAWAINKAWDGNRGSAGGSSCSQPGPHSLTLDMGVTGRLAYFHLFTWKSLGEGYPPFSEANVKKFEVWGSETLDESGSWASWTKLMDCDVTKPSGLPLGQYNADDIQASDLGQKFYNTANYNVKVRYLRIRILQTWEGMACYRVSEIELYGKPD